MKKIGKILLVFSCLLLVIRDTTIFKNSFVEIVYAEDIEYKAQDIFSENYDLNYKGFTPSGWSNRLTHEIINKYDIDGLTYTKAGVEAVAYPIKNFFSDPVLLNDMNDNTVMGRDNYIEVRGDNEIYGVIPEEEAEISISFPSELINNRTFIEFLFDLLDPEFDYTKTDFTTLEDEGPEIRGSKLRINTAGVIYQGESRSRLILRLDITEKVMSNEIIDLSIFDVDGINKVNIFDYKPTIIDAPEQTAENVPAELMEPESIEEIFNSNDYKVIDYGEIMRERDGKKGTKHTFYAEVLQYFETNGKATALLMRNGNSDLLYQVTFKSLPDKRLIEGDNVDVYGTLTGLRSYTTVRGNENTTPGMEIDKILIKGIDY